MIHDGGPLIFLADQHRAALEAPTGRLVLNLTSYPHFHGDRVATRCAPGVGIFVEGHVAANSPAEGLRPCLAWVGGQECETAVRHWEALTLSLIHPLSVSPLSSSWCLMALRGSLVAAGGRSHVSACSLVRNARTRCFSQAAGCRHWAAAGRINKSC